MQCQIKFFRSCALLAVMLLLPCKAYVCMDYPPQEWRFWLFQPDVAGLNELIPFTFSEELFFSGAWYLDQGDDSLNCLANTREWQALLGSGVATKDIDIILYQTEPDQFNAGKISSKKNTFLNALQQPQHADLLAYMQFAKQCEQAMSASLEIPDLKKAREAGQVLFPKTTHPFAKLRIAYQLLKLNAYLGNEPGMREQLDFIQKNAPADAWVRDRALYNYAVGQRNMDDLGRYDYWLSRAFDECRWNREWLIRCFRPAHLENALELAQNKHERAVLETMVALQYPGRALDRLRKVWAQDPQYPILSLLLAREINKLENWILTPQLTGGTIRVEMSLEEEGEFSREALLRSDLDYLHKLLDFTNTVLDSGKIPDPDFWRLSAAHLTWLDGDFAKTRQHLSQIPSPDKLPMRLKVQFQLTQLLAELLESKTITPEIENNIADIFALLDQERGRIQHAQRFQSQLALYLSDAFIQRGSPGKGVLFLNKTRQRWSCPFGSYLYYYKLLEIAKPADYDELLALLSRKPVTPFERWLTADPVPFDEDVWDGEEENMDYITVGHSNPAKDLGVIREFKARYYIWEDQLDSACAVLDEVPDKQTGQYADYPDMFDNPFSVGIAIPGVPLVDERTDAKRDEVQFFRKIMALKETVKKDTADRQANYMLLGNAYFNMTYMGRWWNVFHTNGRSKGSDMRYSEVPPAAPGKADPPCSGWPIGIGMLGLMLTGLLKKKRRNKFLLFAIAGSVVSGFWNCKPVEAPPKARHGEWKPLVSESFDAAYFCCDRAKSYYIKALEENPKNDVAIIAAYMIGLCQKAREAYEFDKVHPYDYFDYYSDVQREEVVYGPNRYLQKLPAGKKITTSVSCAAFRSFLEREGR